MSELFKDRVSQESYASLLALLRGDPTACRIELLGVSAPEVFHGKPDRSACTGLGAEDKESDGKEKRVCKCLYYYSKDPKNCEKHPECDYLKRGRRYRIHETSEYRIEDYEIPPYDKVKGVGNVDLILKGQDGTLYATEVKPPEKNPESLLRMIAEIVTYSTHFHDPILIGITEKVLPSHKKHASVNYFTYETLNYQAAENIIKQFGGKSKTIIFSSP